MSTLAVKVERIGEVLPHPNADRLDIVKVLDWYCVTGKDTYKAGDLCIYIPIDSLLPQDLETHLFSDAKIKLHNHRIKTIKIRGSISQGMVVATDDISKFLGCNNNFEEGEDVTSVLGIKKYEPPVRETWDGSKIPAPKRKNNPHFHKYTDIENAKNYPDVFEVGEEVVITEKIHGSNFRAGWVPFEATTLWKRILKYFGLTPEFEFVYGSHNVQLQDRPKSNRKGWYSRRSNSEDGKPIGNIYLEMVEKYNLREILSFGEVVYGEVYGDGVQKNYLYDCAKGERKLVVFDLMRNGKYQDIETLNRWAASNWILDAPILYRGPFYKSKVIDFIGGDSVLAPSQKVREGIVVRPTSEKTHPQLGRQILKYINPDYLLKDQTEFH